MNFFEKSLAIVQALINKNLPFFCSLVFVPS
nr:MAG TPA: hypothetical protein [Caudoviricetes sp.]